VKQKFIDILHRILKDLPISDEQVTNISEQLVEIAKSLVETEFNTRLTLEYNLVIQPLKTIKSELFEIDSICKTSAENIIKASQALSDLVKSSIEGNNKSDLSVIVAEILTSCEFQDIVNQRIHKIDKLILHSNLEIKDSMIAIIDPVYKKKS
jgi:hypothetical protein